MLLFIFLNYLLRLLIPAVIAQMLNRIAKLVEEAKKAKTEIEIHPVILGAKIRNHSI